MSLLQPDLEFISKKSVELPGHKSALQQQAQLCRAMGWVHLQHLKWGDILGTSFQMCRTTRHNSKLCHNFNANFSSLLLLPITDSVELWLKSDKIHKFRWVCSLFLICFWRKENPTEQLPLFFPFFLGKVWTHLVPENFHDRRNPSVWKSAENLTDTPHIFASRHPFNENAPLWDWNSAPVNCCWFWAGFHLHTCLSTTAWRKGELKGEEWCI